MSKWLGIIVVILVVFLPQNSDELSHTYRGLPSSWTMIPSRSLAGLHYIFKGYKLNEAETLVRVWAPWSRSPMVKPWAPRFLRMVL